MTALKHNMEKNVCVFMNWYVQKQLRHITELTVDGEQLRGVFEPEYTKQDLKNVTELKQLMVINYCMRSAWRRRRRT